MVEDVRRLEASISPSMSPSCAGSGTAHPELVDYPELELVLGLAVSAVVEAFPAIREAGQEAIFGLEQAAADAMLAVYAPIAVLARRKAAEAEEGRAAKAAVVLATAEALAAHEVDVATALQARGDATAHRVATEAAGRAEAVAATIRPGQEAVATQAAAQVAVKVHEAAVAQASKQAVAANIVTRRVALAVSQVAEAAEAQAMAVELQELNAALILEAIAIDSCYRLALEAATTAAHHIAANPRAFGQPPLTHR